MICADPQEFAIRLNFFRREAEILRSLEVVPIVPRVYDLIEQGQSAHLVMEFIRGKDLLKIMEANDNKPFPIDAGHRVGQEHLRRADAHAHAVAAAGPPRSEARQHHAAGGSKTIKMIDFGTARDLGRTPKEKMAAKTRVYTEGYAPPEQIVGKPEPRSDLFALAGTHVSPGHRQGARRLLHGQGDRDAAGRPDGTVPAEQRWFFELIKINLAEDVNDRYFSAREIKADLEKQQVTHGSGLPEVPARPTRCASRTARKCAEPLTDPTPPCYHCGKNNRMGSRCCIHCGNRLR